MEINKWAGRVMILFAIMLFAANANAASVLLAQNSGNLGYGYGYSQWTNFTGALDTATGNQVTTTGGFTDLNQMLQYDAIFLDQRWTGGALAAGEAANIAAFIATGRKAVFIGENDSWTTWNNQILSIVGGTYAGQSIDTALTIINNALTAGVSSIALPTAGLASGGTALFDKNWATLWGENVLTLLDVNVFTDSYWSGDNAQFGINVANWLADSTATPIPGAIWLLGSGLAGLFGLRKKIA